MPRVVHFEIHAEQPERAVAFYSQIFGWDIQKWEGPMPYWLVSTGPDGTLGINGGICQRMDPATTTVNTVDVPSVDEYVAKITAHGGRIAMPKMAIPGVGWLAYLIDTEGNTFGIMQADRGAK